MNETKLAKSDRELVHGVRAGDLDDFAALVNRYRDAYTRFAVRMTGSLLDADDVMQSVWMRAFRNIGACKNPDRFGAWLYQIVVNECRTFTSRRALRDNRFVDNPAESLAALTVSEPDVALREEIEKAITCLPVDQREAFVLKHVEELSYEQIAEITGVGISALKMRVCRACERLRELLEGVHHA
jgi:RNA polymerase sigma-70 factor (ECF subfamily)